MGLMFLGAAGAVTGSTYLVDAGSRRLLVDCGLFQDFKQGRLRVETLEDRSLMVG
jgi:metallo-beta-lactamase family protein